MNFCRRCGTELHKQTEGIFKCDQGHMIFSNAAPACGVFFVTEDNQLLLSVRGIEPYKGMLDAFGGFVEESESLEESIARELEEELGLKPDQYETPRYLCSSPTPYPYGGETRTVLGCLFWTRLKPDAQPNAADDVAELRYVPLKDFDLSQIGNHDVKIGVQKLQELLL